MVSGVGPEEILRKHDVPVVSARPGVGQEMWDHVLFGVVYESNLSTTAILQDPDIVLVLVGIERDLLLLATGWVHVTV